jgi:DNA polymerase
MPVHLPVVADTDDDTPTQIRGNATGAACGECPFGRNGKPSQSVMGIGSSKPIWIIVGEGPGQQERQTGIPFVGVSGQLVNRVLSEIGVNRDSLWITNSMLCTDPGATDDQKKLARKCCQPRLKEELKQFPGKPILALGAVAAQNFCGDRFSITQMAGAHFEVDADGTGELRSLIPTIHPAAILRGGSAKGGGGGHTTDLAYWNLLYDAQKINLLTRGRDIKFTEDVLFEGTDVAKAQKLLEDFVVEARQTKLFALDTETYVDNKKQHSALSPFTAKLSAIGLATEKYAISIAWNILTTYGKNLIGELLADPEMTVIFHNSTYDLAVLTKHEFVINAKTQDTLLAHHNAFPGLAHGLQRVITQFQLTKPWKSEFQKSEGVDGVDGLLRYCALDTLSTARVLNPLQIIIKRSQAEKTYEIDKSMARVAAQMHLDGVPIDREVNESLRQGFKKHIEEVKTELYGRLNDPGVRDMFHERLATEQAKRVRKHDPQDDYLGRVDKRLEEIRARPPELMLDAGEHVVAFLKACGVPLSLTTATGRISTKKEILESVIRFKEVQELLTYRENSKLNNTFAERMFDRILPNGKILYGHADSNNRIHPRWNVFAITGRWRSEGPTVQNWPKADKKKGRPNLRSQVVAPKNRQLVAFDAKQLEARIIALLSGDPFLCNIFKNGRDIHTEFAKLIWPDFDQKHVDERKVLRDLVKRPEYCLVPGTRVLTEDLRWVPIETLKVNDRLIGFSATQPGQRWKENYFKPSVVQATKTIKQPCYRVVTTKGEFTASDEHLWVGGSASEWLRTDQLRTGERLIFTDTALSAPRGAEVLSVEFVGEREVIALQTSTETFIAEGFLSHNCTFYAGMPETAWKAVVRDYPSVTLQMITGMVHALHRQMPGIDRWHQNMRRQVDATGEVRSAILGRRRVFPLKQFDPSEAINFPSQATGADIIDMGLHEIMPQLPDDCFPILHIHDAIVFDCRAEDVDLVKQLVIKCFTRQVTYNGITMDFPVDAKSGSSWAEVN